MMAAPLVSTSLSLPQTVLPRRSAQVARRSAVVPKRSKVSRKRWALSPNISVLRTSLHYLHLLGSKNESWPARVKIHRGRALRLASCGGRDGKQGEDGLVSGGVLVGAWGRGGVGAWRKAG